MNHADFKIGLEFFCDPGLWRCTDIGTRTIAAIRVDRVEAVGGKLMAKVLDKEKAEAEGWFRGPPYAVAERLFDENDIEGCLPIHKLT